MDPYIANIQDKTLKNNFFRHVLATGFNMQLVVMSLKPGEEIGMEVHDEVDQFFRIEKGLAKFVLDGKEHTVSDDEIVIIPAGTRHNIINISKEDDLKLYTIYSPPQHPSGTIHKTKKEADENE